MSEKSKKTPIWKGMKVGQEKTIEKNGRRLTFKRVTAFGKNKNLKTKLVSNKPIKEEEKLTIAQAKAIHKKRSNRSKKRDEAETSQKVTTSKAWAKHPEKMDYPNVDTKKEVKK